MRYPPDLLDEIRACLPVSQVVARRVQLKRQGREFVGLSPFKQEKTPSFTVNDQKGFYHCFASGEHGDIFKFLMKTEGLSFPEAIERLAAEAGVSLPKATPEMVRREGERERLLALMERASAYFEGELKAATGREARNYLDQRGVQPQLRAQFRIGYAHNDRFALKNHLSAAGFMVEEMAIAGMVIAGDDIAVPYDRFRNRIIFPITDLRGRVIAFGGRAMDPSQPAKYLNSPETPLFHKGSVLFNADKARQAAYENGSIVVAEGYMDIIALVGAGIANAVAPLGTALTEQQIRLLWRMAPEPVLCFDGDAAGTKAAHRALETALPLLQPGLSLRFAFLPEGLDPDDLVRRAGRGAMAEVLSAAMPLVDVLWQREWQAGNWSTPERRASLEQRLRGLVECVGDMAVKTHYHREISARLKRVWSAAQGNQRSQQRQTTGASHRSPARRDMPRRSDHGRLGAPASASLLQSGLIQGAKSLVTSREALIVRTLLNHPWLIDEHADAIAALEFETAPMSKLRDAILQVHALENPLNRTTLHHHLDRLGLGNVVTLAERANTHRSDRFSEPDASEQEVALGWRDTVSLQRRGTELERAMRSAEEAYLADQTPKAQAQLMAVRNLLENTERQEPSLDGFEVDQDVAPRRVGD